MNLIIEHEKCQMENAVKDAKQFFPDFPDFSG